MRPILQVLLLASFFAAAQSQPPTGTPLDADKKKIRLEGSVLSVNGEAIRKATLRLQGSGPAQNGQPPANYTESTDAAGKFVFEDVAEGRYTLAAEKAGFVTQRYGARSTGSSGTTLNLVAGVVLKDLNIKMTPQGVISGKVTDQDNDPVNPGRINVMRFTYPRGRKQLSQIASAATNDQGEFRIANLAPGRYYLSVTDTRAVGIATSGKEAQEGNVTTYYPNVLDPAGAAPLDVTAGVDLRGIDIRMRRAKVYSIRGKAVDPSGAPAANAVVTFSPKNIGDSPTISVGVSLNQVKPDGSFEFRNLTAGTYVIQTLNNISLNGSSPSGYAGRGEITITDSNIEGAVLMLVPGAEINGTVKLEGGDLQTLLKPQGSQSAGAPALPAQRITFTLADIDGVALGSAGAQVKEDGTFKFTGLGSNKYAMNFNGLPQGAYVKSVRYGGQDVTHSLLDMSTAVGGNMEVTLSDKAADVSGSVHTDKGEAIPGVQVTLWPKNPDPGSTSAIKQANTDQNGGFKFTSLPPGDYYVAAWEELDTGLAQSADFLKNFTSDGAAVKLNEGSHESVDTKVVSRDRIVAEMAKIP